MSVCALPQISGVDGWMGNYRKCPMTLVIGSNVHEVFGQEHIRNNQIVDGFSFSSAIN